MNKKFYLSLITDPYLNLAIENELLLTLKPDEKILFVYINRPCVVMGRFQNPWVECNFEFMQEHDIWPVRRQSGGGCVYHDEGNLNFSFLDCNRDLAKKENNQYIIQALSDFGIKAFSTGRSDLKVHFENLDYKISGSAFKQKKDRSFHHGTLLINSNMDLLRGSLKDPEYDIQSKSIASVRSKSLCLQRIHPELAIESVINSLQKSFGVEDKQVIDTSFISEGILGESERLKSWDWLIGETPYFEYEGKLIFKKGVVIDSKVEGIKVGQKITDIDFKAFCSQQVQALCKPLYTDY